MKKAHPGGNQGGPEALDQSSQDLINMPSPDLSNRRIDRIYNLGLRAVGELLAELGADPLILERYAALTPDMLIATGSTGWPVSVFVIEGGRP